MAIRVLHEGQAQAYTLTTGLGKVGLIGVDDVDGLSAGEVRRLACDAGVIPVVLGGPSRLLDVGRTYRMFTPGLRAALVQRDGGCAFPGCAATPACCEAHHIEPWWQGGVTRLGNGVLLCPHHHRLVEPDPLQSEASQWRVLSRGQKWRGSRETRVQAHGWAW